MECGYCGEPIEQGQPSIYMYFPEDGTYKKTHFYHYQYQGDKDKDK